MRKTATMQEIRERLRYHAGLTHDLKSAVCSVADALWQKASVAEPIEDVPGMFSRMNRAMNGPVPSESTVHVTHLPVDIVYAATEIIRLLHAARRESPDEAERAELDRCSRKLELAWSAILSGDIDDVYELIAGEEAFSDGSSS